MGNFGNKRYSGGGGGGRGGFGGGGRSAGGRGGFGGGRDRGRPEMHPATCADCGNRCEVPFRPTGDKPVYCSNCFGGKDDRPKSRDFGRDSGRDFGRDRGRRDRGGSQMHQAVCANCGNNCEVPFKPTGNKPVLCSNCFGGNATRVHSPVEYEGSSKKHDEILTKLDKIINLLQRTSPVKEVTVMKSDLDVQDEEEVFSFADKPKKAEKKAKKKVAVKKSPASKKVTTKKKVSSKKPTATSKASGSRAKKAPAKKKVATKKALKKK